MGNMAKGSSLRFRVVAVSAAVCVALFLTLARFDGDDAPKSTAVATAGLQSAPGPLLTTLSATSPAPKPAEPGTDVLENDTFAEIQRSIEAREYRASRNRSGLQAPNRKHGLRTYFEPAGIRVHDRTAEGSPELLSMRWTGLGRGERLAAVPKGEVVANGGRVEIQRSGRVEWYENTASGLEQGFTLAEPPAGGRCADPGTRAR